MQTLRLVLADQLSDSIASLRDVHPSRDLILMCEVHEEATYVKHHKKKIAFLFAAMRHFAQALVARGLAVRYVKLDDPDNSGSFAGELQRAVAAWMPDRLVITEPGEYRVLRIFRGLEEQLSLPVEIRADDRFLCATQDFKTWAHGKKQLRMEFFYREMRKRYGILMDAPNKPAGGAWNYDQQNRKPPKAGMQFPKRVRHPRSETTREVLALVAERFADHFGALEPFHLAVTRAQAIQELHHFLDLLLPHFGDYQDAMVMGEAQMYHSLLSAYLNAGLLLPLEVCQFAEKAYREGKAPLNAAEGFIRQILGWREYVRGIYWMHMPDYAEMNFFAATRPLPSFYWDGRTRMACVAEAVQHTRERAYSHHIQRLMVTGNFALLAGIDPRAVCEWYLLVYADAYEWVELPNTLGMALFGDGGIMASKPYAASGKYIHRMSNYCEHCVYDPDEAVGDKACPFNALYWDFMARNADKLRHNQRMPYVFATWEKMGETKQAAIRAHAATSLAKMQDGML